MEYSPTKRIPRTEEFVNRKRERLRLYEAYSDCNRMDDAVIKEDFHRLYEQMNGLSLRDMDRILDPVYTLCRSHERCGFVEGIKVGVRLIQELNHT